MEAAPVPAGPPGDARRRYRAIAIGLVASDALCLVGALLVSYVVRFGFTVMPLDFAIVVLVAPLVWVGVFQALSLYAPWRLSAAEEFRRIVGGVSLGIVLVVMASFWSNSSFSRIWVGLTWIFVLAFELLVRRGWRLFVGRLKVDGRAALRTLIVGANEEAVALGDALAAPGSGFVPIGFVGAADADHRTEDVVGSLHELAELVPERGADCLFVASTGVRADELAAVAKTARRAGADLWISANLPQLLATRLTVQPVGRAMAVSVNPVQLTGAQSWTKRTFDLAVALVATVVLAPVVLLAAIAVAATSRGGALYRQERIGRGGEPFTMLKLRTMVVDADERRAGLSDRNEAAAPLFKVRDDPRVTRVGRFLRRWSIDELPQLANVLRGDMSLVGPRPPLGSEVAAYEEAHHDRLEVRPGMTGLWQVSGRSDLRFGDYVRLDIFYIESWSLSYDVFILLKTLGAIVRGRGSY